MTATITRLGRNASKIAPKAMRWLVPNVLAQGIATCLTGPGGVGKSTLMIEWAASLSVGRPLVPGGKILPPCESVIVSTEESAESVVRPKLDAAGADLSRVTIFDEVEDTDDRGDPMMRGLRLPSDADLILTVVRETGAALLVLDPVSELLDDKHSSNNEQEVRRALARIRRGCRELGCAVVWLQHINQAGKPMGSVAWVNMARVQLQVARHPHDEARSVLYQAKTNHGKSDTWEFHVDAVPWAALYPGSTDDPDGDNTVAYVTWDGVSLLTRDDIEAGGATKAERTERTGAVEVIEGCMHDGVHAWKDIMARAREYGFSEKTMKDAAAARNIRPTRPYGRQSKVEWRRVGPAPFAPAGNGHHPEEPVPEGPRDTLPVCSTCGVPVDPEAGCRTCANAFIVWKNRGDLS